MKGNYGWQLIWAVSIPASYPTHVYLNIQDHTTFHEVRSISIGFHNGRKRRNSPLVHTHTANSSFPCVLYHLFLALCFPSFLPVEFPFTKVFILPGRSTTMSCFISAFQDRRPLEPMGCETHAKAISWWMTAVSHRGITKNKKFNLTMYVMKLKEGNG